jgi:hypothetical protein
MHESHGGIEQDHTAYGGADNTTALERISAYTSHCGRYCISDLLVMRQIATNLLDISVAMLEPSAHDTHERVSHASCHLCIYVGVPPRIVINP